MSSDERQDMGGKRAPSERFIRLSRNPDAPRHTRFERTVKQPGDVVL